MWQKLIDVLKYIFKIQELVEGHNTDIRTLQQEVRNLSTAVQLLARELQHLREYDAQEREKMALRLENVLLKFEKRLPATKNEDNE